MVFCFRVLHSSVPLSRECPPPGPTALDSVGLEVLTSGWKERLHKGCDRSCSKFQTVAAANFVLTGQEGGTVLALVEAGEGRAAVLRRWHRVCGPQAGRWDISPWETVRRCSCSLRGHRDQGLRPSGLILHGWWRRESLSTACDLGTGW